MITTVLVLQTPATIAELQQFIDKAKVLAENDCTLSVRCFGKDLRFKWPQDSSIDEGNLSKASLDK